MQNAGKTSRLHGFQITLVIRTEGGFGFDGPHSVIPLFRFWEDNCVPQLTITGFCLLSSTVLVVVKTC